GRRRRRRHVALHRSQHLIVLLMLLSIEHRDGAIVFDGDVELFHRLVQVVVENGGCPNRATLWGLLRRMVSKLVIVVMMGGGRRWWRFHLGMEMGSNSQNGQLKSHHLTEQCETSALTCECVWEF